MQVLGITLLDQQCLHPFSHCCVSIYPSVWVIANIVSSTETVQTFTTTGQQSDELPWKHASWQTIWQSFITESAAAKQNPQWHEHILWYRCWENFFHEVFTMIIAKLQYLHTRGKLSASSIEHYHSPIAHSLLAEVTSIFKIFPHRFWWTKCEGTLLTLIYNRISKGSHSLATHTVHRERKGLVMLQLSSCSHGNQSALRSS